jgi:capsular polysaccharide export protein
MDANQVTDVVLLGEHRSYHKLAVEVAKARGTRVTVTDFGYLRPDWITLEADGMSGCSRFPRNPGQILRLASALPEVDLAPRYADSSWKMAVGDLLYSFGNAVLWWLYPFYRRSDRRPHPLIYFPAIGMRLLRVKAGHRPTIEEALGRLDHLRAHGSSEHAFGWDGIAGAQLWKTARCA